MMKAITIIILLVISSSSFAQHEEGIHESNDAHSAHHKITLVMANSLITNHIDDQSNAVLMVPTFGLNYDFMFHSKWGVGLHSDIILQQFKVEKHEGHEELIRENPVAVCLVGLFKPAPKLSLLAGYGVEIETHENLQLLRFGVEYGVHLPKNWELGCMLEYDIKFKTYGTFMFGVGFSKILS
jgi:hypothetical protein